MENLPLDLLRRIFELACTDGGYTGNSLSLTSKAIRKASRATRFHSIFLNAGPRRLRSFLDLYERECDASFEDKPRIRHLYASFHVSDLKESQSDRSRAPPSSTNRPVLSDEFLSDEDDAAIDTSEFGEQLAKALRDMKLFPAVPSPQRANQTSSAEYREAARTLFRLVAPDLWSLVLQVGYNYRTKLSPPILEDAFPLLRELVVVGSTNPRDLFVAGPTNNSTLLPSLVHLHLGTGVNNPMLHLSLWSLVAPTVTHLRITGTCRLQELELAVGVVYEPSRIAVHPSPLVSFVQRISRSLAPQSKAIPPPPTYPSLRYLLIQPDPSPGPVGFCGTPMVEYMEAIEALEEFLTQCRSAGIQGTLLPPLSESIICGKLAAHVKWQWTKRLDGDMEYWDVGQHV